MNITPALQSLIGQATARSRFWIFDAVQNIRDGVRDDISDAIDAFVQENGAGSEHLANQILAELGEDETATPILPRQH